MKNKWKGTIYNYGNNSCVVGSPNIDVNIQFQVILSPKKDGNGSWLWVNGTSTGDKFPSNEQYLEDELGNKVMLGVSGLSTGLSFLAPETELPGNNKREMSNYEFTIEMDASNNFVAVWFNCNKYTLSEWNQKFKNLSAESTETKTSVSSKKGKFLKR